MKYKIWDKVRIKPLEELENNWAIVPVMLSMAWHIVTIKKIMTSNYNINEDNYFWTDDMFSWLVEETSLPKELNINWLIYILKE
mgnify:FL=1